MSAKSIMVFTSFPWRLALAGALACTANQNHIHSGPTRLCALRSVSVANPVIYKRLCHRSGQIKGLGKGNKLTERYLAFLRDLILKTAVFIKPQCIIMFL